MSRKKMKIYRELIFDFPESIIQILTKISIVDVEKEFIHFDKLPDKTWRMTISKKTLEKNEAEDLRSIFIQ